MAFDLSDLLKGVSESDTGREQIEYIPLELIDGDPGNFYELSAIEQLANNIATIGLQQPLRLRPNPEAEGRYRIVSGHRRKAALVLLAADDPERWKETACIVQRDSVSPAMQQLRLIFANSDTRKMSSADLSEQAAQVEKLLYQLKEEGYEFPGRMRDHVAQVVQVSKTKLAKMKMIRDNLAPCWQPDYKKSDLCESSAYELSKMSTENQQLLYDALKTSGRSARNLWAETIEKCSERFDTISKLKCKKQREACTCQNAERKKQRAAVLHYYQSCNCTKCCGSCGDLATCKYACPVFADKIKKIKADKKEARRQEQLAQDERDRPTIEKLQQLWMRFGYAREQSGKTAKQVYEAADMWYSKGDDEKMDSMERCIPKFSTSTTLPYGYSCHLSEVKRYIAIADLFGCSIDYLFCRTDVREVAQAAPEATEKVSHSDTGWNTGDPVERGEYIVLVRFSKTRKFVPQTLEWNGTGWEAYGQAFDFDGDQIYGWMKMPPEVPKEKSSEAQSPLNHSCKTGMSSSGHCGAAATCPEPADCCLNCDKDCNLRCGWTEE